VNEAQHIASAAGVQEIMGKAYTREDVLAIRSRINQARQTVIERYGSVIEAPDDCVEIKMLQYQSQLLPDE